MNSSPRVYFIGAGPGDPGLITVRGQELIKQADLVLYAGSLVPREVVACARPDAKVLDSAGMSLEQTHALICQTVLAGGLAARVHTGDPSLYGAIREQRALLDRDGIAHATIPGVTVAFAAAARADVSFTVPEETQSLVITRLSGRTPVPDTEALHRLAAHGSSMALYLSADKADEVAQELRRAGLAPDTSIVIGHKVGHPDESIVRTTLATLPESVRQHHITRQAVFLILPAETAQNAPSRLYDAAFGHGFRQAAHPESWPRLAVYAMTRQGLEMGKRIATMAPADLFAPLRLQDKGIQGFTRIADQVRTNFTAYHAHIFVAATGIVVRAIAPLLESKTTDPAVVVCDQNGEHVVSLLSGHLGGANDLARRIATHVNAQPVITTATDTAKVSAIDTLARQAGCTIFNPQRIKDVNSLLAEGESVLVFDPEQCLALPQTSDQTGLHRTTDPERAAVVVTWQRTTGQSLTLHPRCLVAGIGCRRGVSRDEILTALQRIFEQHALAPSSLASLASADLKCDEAGLLEAAATLGIPLECVDRAVLADTPVPNPSARVLEKIGVESVCEAAALTVARSTRLIVPKTIMGNVTIAVALAG